jgi:hypothetical protein
MQDPRVIRLGFIRILLDLQLDSKFEGKAIISDFESLEMDE